MSFQMPHYGGMDLGGLRNLKYFGLSGVCLPEITPESIKETQSDAPTMFYEVAALAGQTCNDQDKQFSVCGMDENRYSMLRKLLRGTAYCLKFIKQRIWSKLSINLKVPKEISINCYCQCLIRYQMKLSFQQKILNWQLCYGCIVFNRGSFLMLCWL